MATRIVKIVVTWDVEPGRYVPGTVLGGYHVRVALPLQQPVQNEAEQIVSETTREVVFHIETDTSIWGAWVVEVSRLDSDEDIPLGLSTPFHRDVSISMASQVFFVYGFSDSPAIVYGDIPVNIKVAWGEGVIGTVSDIGSASDTVTIVEWSASADEVGFAYEVISIVVETIGISDTDSGAAAESLAISVVGLVAEAGSAADSVFVAVEGFGLAEVGIAVDDVSIGVEGVIIDEAGLADDSWIDVGVLLEL